MNDALTSRPATRDDVPALTALMDAAIAELQRGFLDEEQIASSRAIMGIDTQLIDDGTYFVVEIGGELAGCGGWSRRATLYGGNQTPGRDARLLDPATEPARVRAMYTSPVFARRGVGRRVLELCEEAAAAEGFTQLELMATLSGEPLYTAYGFRPVERLSDDRGGAPVPLVRMAKAVDPALRLQSAGTLTNRSAPPATVTPVLVYPDVRAAVDWLTAALGFRECVRIGESHRAQMRIGADGAVVVADVGGSRVAPGEGTTHIVKVRVDDVDEAFARACRHSGVAVEEPHTWEYGERSCVVEDPGGHRWELTQTVRDVAPEEWGGTTVSPW